MNINEVMSLENQKALLGKITQEYSDAEKHTQTWRSNMNSVAERYLLPTPNGQDMIKDKSVLQNLLIRQSIFVADDIQVTNVPMNGKLGVDMASNCDKVFTSNFRTMKIRSKYRSAITDDGLYGIGVLAVDGWNNHTQEPITSYIDSRLCYGDPKNWEGNEMRFFGTKIKKNYWELLTDEAYDINQVNKVKAMTDTDQKDVERGNNNVKGFQEVPNGDDLIELYNHITVFKEPGEEPHLYLCTLGADRNEFVRIVKMRPLTEGEKADPSTIDLGVKLFRGKPLPGSWAGVSLIDDIGQFQDLLTLFTNLNTEKAKEQALGGRKYLNTELGVDEDDVATTGAGEIVWYTPEEGTGATVQNSIFEEQPRPQSQIVQDQISAIQQMKQQADPASTSIATGVGEPGSQTKGEIQTLQQNINQILGYMQSNYMESLKELRESIYRSYSRNMSSQRKKEIAIVGEDGVANSYGFKKSEFISKGDIYIVVKSKREEEAKNSQDFAKLLTVYGSIAQTMNPESDEYKKLQRMLLRKSGIRGLSDEDIVSLSPDERQAYEDLELLNNDEDVLEPLEGQNHNTFINIYKTGLQTPARDNAIRVRERMIQAGASQPAQAPQSPQGGGVAQQLGASMLASDNAQGEVPSLAQI